MKFSLNKVLFFGLRHAGICSAVPGALTGPAADQSKTANILHWRPFLCLILTLIERTKDSCRRLRELTDQQGDLTMIRSQYQDLEALTFKIAESLYGTG